MSKRLIYAEDAIDAVAEGLKRTFVEYRDVAEKMLNKVPSAQPEQIARDIATIIENEKDMRVILKNERTETHDLISRQAAIDSVCENCEYFYNEKLIQTIKDLPSVQPEARREWYMRGYRDAERRQDETN